MQVRSLGLEDPLEEGMATHSSILACRIPQTEEPVRLCMVHWVTESDMTEVTYHKHIVNSIGMCVCVCLYMCVKSNKLFCKFII